MKVLRDLHAIDRKVANVGDEVADGVVRAPQSSGSRKDAIFWHPASEEHSHRVRTGLPVRQAI
ncbi:hypothetical protein [Bradyrhizobium sp. JYMT SZCCT0428]|uniref:hypothetical protein n=1 Tax=Bradyrhizobium sp. JYMT SZCCT0428 TaxID=2807673 RepID=UPI001BAC5D2C|nr:hypothetical protein [Bradyrhizobium sp. JYMT SZCCT0428]MBR1156205.1 hypothetical protein [Bradyrhizobium sp. JYMT SZCCT0428]